MAAAQPELRKYIVYMLADYVSSNSNGNLDPENVGIAVRISSLSCIQAEIFVIAYVLPVMAAIFDFPGRSCIDEYSL